MNFDKHLLDELARQEVEGVVPRQKFDPARAVVIRRRSDGAWLTHLAGPVIRFHLLAGKPIQFFSRARAELTIRCDLGEDLSAFEIVPARELQTATLAGSLAPTAPARSAAA